MKRARTVESYIESKKQWSESLLFLRELLGSTSLEDSSGKLINAQEGVTKALRQWRFSSADEIRDNKELIVAYLEEAIQNQKDGKEIKADRNKPLKIPDELQQAFKRDPSLQESFDKMALSKRREYAEYITLAKREETRIQRLEKIRPMILEGLGLNDKYKS